MKADIIKAWNAVNESLSEIWEPIVNSIGIPNISWDDYNAGKILYDQCKHFDNNLWSGLTAILKESIGSIATVSQDDTYFKISFPDISEMLFQVCFSLETLEDSSMGTVDPDEVNGKFRLEVIDYLTKKEVFPSFQYVEVDIHAGEIWERRLIGRDCAKKDLYEYIGAIVDGLLKTPIVYNLLKSKQNEINERHRLIEERERAQKQEDECLAKAFANMVKPHIENTGWNDQWRVYKELCHFVLEL